MSVGCLGSPLGRQVSKEAPKEGDVGGLVMGLPYTLMRLRSLEDDETTAFIWGFQEFFVPISCACCRLLYTGQGTRVAQLQVAAAPDNLLFALVGCWGSFELGAWSTCHTLLL